jgi:RNA12 protein
MIALYDANASSALSFVKQKLRDNGVELDYSKEQVDQVKKLGGRASDLEIVKFLEQNHHLPLSNATSSLQLIHKVCAGQKVEEAVEDIIQRGMSELRKNAFGDDIEDSKSLPWTREQAWAIIQQLSKKVEVCLFLLAMFLRSIVLYSDILLRCSE